MFDEDFFFTELHFVSLWHYVVFVWALVLLFSFFRFIFHKILCDLRIWLPRTGFRKRSKWANSWFHLWRLIFLIRHLFNCQLLNDIWLTCFILKVWVERPPRQRFLSKDFQFQFQPGRENRLAFSLFYFVIHIDHKYRIDDILIAIQQLEHPPNGKSKSKETKKNRRKIDLCLTKI